MIQKLKLNQYNRIANHVPIIKRNVEYIYIKISITVLKKYINTRVKISNQTIRKK